jgi:hypothetical protein
VWQQASVPPLRMKHHNSRSAQSRANRHRSRSRHVGSPQRDKHPPFSLLTVSYWPARSSYDLPNRQRRRYRPVGILGSGAWHRLGPAPVCTCSHKATMRGH